VHVTILGHASLLLETKNERILLDPVLRTTSLLGSVVHQYPRALNIESMPTPTLLVITHAHYDHFDLETLEKLPKDIPVVIPSDRKMERQLESIGFAEFRILDPWKHTTHGSVRLTATPSEADVTEFGLLVETNDARLWHMSDAEPPLGTSAKILSELGPLDVVSVKYQPPDPLLNFLHNLGSSFDRKSVARWLEHACSCRPKLAFPYASGLCLTQDHAWMNRYAYPFSPEYVSAVLDKRLIGVGKSAVVRPGDIISIESRQVRIEKQASEFVQQCAEETSIEWEPIEGNYLREISRPADKQTFKDELTKVVAGGEFSAWLQAHPKLLKPFQEWRVLCQFAVHLDEIERMYFQADFTGGSPEARLGKNPAANYFLHLSGDAAKRMLAGQASSAEVMYQGGVRIFERIVSVRNDQVDAPDAKHLYGNFPDPFLCFANARAKLGHG
jgi:L-ascorbate metabolism protein UlaG (beta-lactamase superfamily)